MVSYEELFIFLEIYEKFRTNRSLEKLIIQKQTLI